VFFCVLCCVRVFYVCCVCGVPALCGVCAVRVACTQKPRGSLSLSLLFLSSCSWVQSVFNYVLEWKAVVWIRWTTCTSSDYLIWSDLIFFYNLQNFILLQSCSSAGHPHPTVKMSSPSAGKRRMDTDVIKLWVNKTTIKLNSQRYISFVRSKFSNGEYIYNEFSRHLFYQQQVRLNSLCIDDWWVFNYVLHHHQLVMVLVAVFIFILYID
jgi:hypothetical protein